MKISKKELVRLIKEEISNLFSPEDEREAATAGIDPLFVDKGTNAVRQMHLSPLEKRKALQAKQDLIAKQKARKTARAMRVDEQPEQTKLGKDIAKPAQAVAPGANKPGQQVTTGASPSGMSQEKEDEKLNQMFANKQTRLGLAEAKKLIRKIVKEELSRLKK